MLLDLSTNSTPMMANRNHDALGSEPRNVVVLAEISAIWVRILKQTKNRGTARAQTRY